jgi:hypothetical protein
MKGATREIMERETDVAAGESAPLPMRVVLYAGERCVTVESPPHPAPMPGDGVCRCAACRAVAANDLTEIVR